MKRILLFFMAICSMAVSAQTLHENESALIYYMPYTELYAVIEYDEITTTTGPFYQYSERYLGTKDVIIKDETYFAITNITFATKTKADKTREFVVNSTKDVNATLLSINFKGMLTGYNLPMQADQKSNKKSTAKESLQSHQSNSSTIMPLMEEYLLAGSITKQAEGAAKQIYRIREDRMDILAGNTEHAPADGRAMEKVLNELDKQETALTALFIGNTTIKHHTKYIALPLDNAEETIAFRFSKYLGVVDSDDLSGEPIYMDMSITKQNYKPYGEKEKAKKIANTGIYYNIPGEASVRLFSPILATDYETTKPIAQFGISVPVTAEMLKDTHISFDPITGNIISITK